MQLEPAAGTALFFVDDEAVLFHEAPQKLFQLNAMAAVVWCLIEDGMCERGIAARLEAIYHLDAASASAYVRQAVMLLQGLGVLRGSEKPFDPGLETKSAPVLASCDEYIAERCYRLLGSVLRLRFTDVAQVCRIEPVLAHLATDADGKATCTVDIIRREGGRIAVVRDSRWGVEAGDLDELAPLVKAAVWQASVCAHSFFLDIHAGVTGDGRHAFLFPAAAGSGKSTLTAALVHAGFEYFSDEVALLHEPDFTVEPVPLALCVKDTGVAVLSRFFPQLTALREHRRGDGKRVRYLPPPAQAVAPPATRRPVGAMFFPSYESDRSTQLAAITTMEALRALTQECLIVDSRLTRDKVAALLDWLGHTPRYRLVVSDIDQAVSLVAGVASDLRSAPQQPIPI